MMGFSKRLNEAIKEKGLTGKELSDMTGISESMISEYRNGGASPTPERKNKLCSVLGIDEFEPVKEKRFKQEVEFVDLDEVAGRMGISRDSVMSCLKQKQFPEGVGFCWRGRYSNQWNYRIFRKPFEKMMEVLGGEK